MLKQQQHESPSEFVCHWIVENAFQAIGYVGSFPGLPKELAHIVALKDCNSLASWHDTEALADIQAIIICGDTENFTRQEHIQLLAGFRNALVEGILMLSERDSDLALSPNDFYGLGFNRIAEFPHPQHPLVAFEYNLRNYNHKRLWNNSKYWANPENFGKYWW